MIYKTLLIAAATSLLFLGCATTSQVSNSAPTQKQSSKNLEGTTWKLVSFGLTRMAVPKDASIRLKEGQYSGKGGCNGVGGNYELNGNKLIFVAGFSTMMACPELDLEHKYMKALSKVESYSVEGDMLDLQGKGRSLLRFKAE